MDRRGPHQTTAPRLQNRRYRDYADDDEVDEALPLTMEDEELEEEQPPWRPRKRWQWSRPARMQRQQNYRLVSTMDEEEGGLVSDETIETDIEDDNGDGNNDGNCNGDAQREERESRHGLIPGATWYQAQRPGSVIAIAAVLLFFLVAAATMALVPMMRLVEDAICRKYYEVDYRRNATVSINAQRQFLDDGEDERLCKVDAVQSELAWLGAIGSATKSILGLLMSFPWALLSDRIGRKPVFRISFIGAAASFAWTSLILMQRDVLSVWWVLTTEVFLLVGGGSGVTVTILHSVVADVLPTDRSSGFIWLSVGAVTGAILGPGAAAGMMTASGSAWLPIGVTLFGLGPVIMGLTIFLPETLKSKKAGKPASSLTRQRAAGFWKDTAPAHVRETLVRLRETVTILRRSRSALLLLPSFLFLPALHGIQGGILAQSVSKRFGWSLAQTGYLFSLRGIVTVVVLALIPAVSYLLVGQKPTSDGAKPRFCRGRLGMSETSKDLLIARLSLVFLVLGNIVIASGQSLATLVVGLVLSTLAVGFGSVIRSLITHYFLEVLEVLEVLESGRRPAQEDAGEAASSSSGDDHTSRLYTLTGMVETMGSVLAGPLLAWTFSAGMSLGGGWIGMPFYYVAFLCVVALGCLLVVDRRGGRCASRTGRIRLSTTEPPDGRPTTIDEDGEEAGRGRIAL